MRCFAITLLSLTLMPTATLWSQTQAVPVVESPIPAELADADVVTAAELETTLTELETAHAQNYNTLAAVIDKVPAEARPALEQALENSKRGYLQAKSNRERTTSMRQTKANARLARSHGQGGKSANAGQMNGQRGQAAQNGQAQSGQGQNGQGQNGQAGRGFAGSPQGQGQVQGQPQFQGQPQGFGQQAGQPATRIAQADSFGRRLSSLQNPGPQNPGTQTFGAPNAGSPSNPPNGGQGRGQARR